MIIGFIVGVFAIVLLAMSVVIVEQKSASIIQRFGKFARVAKPGLNFKIPFIEAVAGNISLRVQQLDVEVETKTEDNVFVDIRVSVQYFVGEDSVYDAFYSLDDNDGQIESFVFDVVRAEVPKIKLDEVFSRKDDIADAVKNELSSVMGGFGFQIMKALVTDISPDEKVREAMNEINAAQRHRVAAQERGEAERVLMVAKARGEAEAKKLQGEGVADQRKAIALGMKQSVEEFEKHIPDVSNAQIMAMLLMTHHYDTLEKVGSNSNNNTLMIPHSGNGAINLFEEMTKAIAAGGALNSKHEHAEDKQGHQNAAGDVSHT